MGRPRKPTSLKILEGAQPCRINGSEPPSPGTLGEPPEWFDQFAIEAWERLKERLAPMRVATRADEECVMVYAQSYSLWRRANSSIESEGLIVESTTEITTKNGSTRRLVKKSNPLLPAVQEAQRRMMACLSQLGMTPSSRSGLHVQAERPANPLVDFMAKRPKAGTRKASR